MCAPLGDAFSPLRGNCQRGRWSQLLIPAPAAVAPVAAGAQSAGSGLHRPSARTAQISRGCRQRRGSVSEYRPVHPPHACRKRGPIFHQSFDFRPARVTPLPPFSEIRQETGAYTPLNNAPRGGLWRRLEPKREGQRTPSTGGANSNSPRSIRARRHSDIITIRGRRPSVSRCSSTPTQGVQTGPLRVTAAGFR